MHEFRTVVFPKQKHHLKNKTELAAWMKDRKISMDWLVYLVLTRESPVESYVGFFKGEDGVSAEFIDLREHPIRSTLTVSDAKSKDYKSGDSVLIHDDSTKSLSIGKFICYTYTKKPDWVEETNNIMHEVDGSNGLKWLIHSKVTGETECIISFEEAKKVSHLFNNSGVVAFDPDRKKLFSIIDNEIYSIQTNKEEL